MKIEIDKFNLLMKNSFKDHKLKDCSVVVDAQNFFYNTYRNSKLPYVFGCECDQYAEFLKKYLSIFKRANVKCFFVFKGGHEDMESRIKKMAKQYHSTAAHFTAGKKHLDIPPIFIKQTCKQVLDEMGFEYVTCEYEAKKQCIALAQKLRCPVISFDKEFCFSSAPYIPNSNLILKNNTIFCKMFRLDSVLEKYHITIEEFVIFVVLKNKCLPPSSLHNFYKNHTDSSNEYILKWLSENKRDSVRKISSCLSTNDREKFLSSQKEVNAFLRRREPEGVPIDYLEHGKDIIGHHDPLWFEKGVACRHIAIPYVNLYRSNMIWGSWAIADLEADDAMTLSLDIVKYAYNLLTNFQKQSFSLHLENGVQIAISVSQPRLQALHGTQHDMFENGWDQLDGASVFNNFLVEIFGGVPVNINEVPEDAKLLMISLAYFTRMKKDNTKMEVDSIILSYIMLGVVNEVCNSKYRVKSGKKSLVDIIMNKPNFKSECQVATTSMSDFFKLSDEEMIDIFDRKLLHPLVEFQHCLEHMNYLNKLCGLPFEPTVYKKTFNGTFVYKILHTLKKESVSDGLSFLEGKLQSSPSILECFNSLIAMYKKMI